MINYAFSTIVIAITSIFIGFIISTAMYSKKEMNLLKYIAKQEKSYDSLNGDYDELICEYNKLVDKHNALIRKHNSLLMVKQKSNYDKEVTEAIKFAMIQSHPDKGICKNNETFIRFRKLYKELV